MDGTFKALRVPIPFLHQKVYGTAHRLPKLPKVEWEDHNKTWRSVPRVHRLPYVFDTYPYLRRGFYASRAANLDEITCRVCLGQTTIAKRGTEHQKCVAVLDETIRRLYALGKCVSCTGVAVYDVRPPYRHEGCPVCSEKCKTSWDTYNPPEFTRVLSIVRKEMKAL